MTAVSTPIYGKLADSLGRKPVFLFGIAVFVIGSALCGIAQNMVELILFRVIQGLGSGAIQPVAVTIIADLYTLEKESKDAWLKLWFLGSSFGHCTIVRWIHCSTFIMALDFLY
jgi:Arabinose efflux permease